MAGVPISTIIDKISENRSKIAVYKMLLLHIGSNYCGSDAGPAESRVVREDAAVVPAKDLQSVVLDITETVLSLKAELSEWENMTVASLPEPEPEEDEEDEDEEPDPEDGEGGEEDLDDLDDDDDLDNVDDSDEEEAAVHAAPQPKRSPRKRGGRKLVAPNPG